MKKISLLLILVTIHVSYIRAQPTTSASAGTFSFNLQQAVDYAMQNQTGLQNALLNEQVAALKVKEIRAIGLPQINAAYDRSHFFDKPVNVVPTSAFGGPPGSYSAFSFASPDNANLGAEASWLAVDAGYLLGLKATKVYLELTKRSTDRARTETISAVKKAYYSVLVNKERSALLTANVDRLKKLLDDTKALNDNGFVEKVDLDRTSVAYNILLTEKEKVERLVALTEVLLKYQMGMDQSASLTLTDNISSVEFSMVNISAEKFDYSKRVEYNMMELQNQGAALQVRKDQFSFLPNLVLFGSYKKNMYQYSDFGPKWYPQSLVGGKISLPIFTSGQRYYKLQQSKIALKQSENDLKFAQQSIDLELKSAQTILQNASQSLDNHKKNITLAEDVYKTTKAKYEQGVGSSLEVLNAETALKEAQTNYFNALYEAVVAKIDYEKATGTLK